MPVGNPGTHISVRYKVEGSFGAGGSGGGAEELPIHAGSGLSLSRGLIEDPTIRDDGQREMARLGGKSGGGSYPATLRVGAFNTLLAALFRNTWTADSIITYNNGAALTSIEVTANNTIVSVGTTTLLASGLRVGKVFRLGSMSNALNNDINLVCASISPDGLTATVLGTPLTVQVADTACTLTIKKHLQNAAVLTRSSFAFEEYFAELDESELFVGCRVTSIKFTFGPNAVVRVEVGIMAQTSSIIPAGAGAPNFTAPTEYVSIGLVSADASIFHAGVAIATITGGELTLDIGGQGIEVVGSQLTPDIWEGQMKATGQITAVRTALTGSHLARFLAETDNVETSLMFVEPDATAPIDFFHIFLPRTKNTAVTKNLGGDGPIVETIPFYGAARATATGYDAVTAVISTSV